MRLPFDRTVVIHLPHRDDREALMATWPFRPDVIHPGMKDRRDIHARVDLPGNARSQTWVSTAGALGCKLAHEAVLRQAVRDNVRTLAVFEDDAVMSGDFIAELCTFLADVPESWQALWLGGIHLVPPEQVKPGVVRCATTLRTHAYVVRGSALRGLLNLVNKAQNHIDHAALPIFDASYQVYAPEPMLVGQAGGWSDVLQRYMPPRW